MRVQAVILTAGRGVRLYPLTLERPKAFLSIGGRPALFHMIPKLIRAGVRDFTVVAPPSGCNLVTNVLGKTLAHSGAKWRVVVQEDALGPGHALALCSEHLAAPTLVLLGDTICDLPSEDARDWIGVAEVGGAYERWCMVRTRSDGTVDLIDKPKTAPDTHLAAVGLYRFGDPDVLRSVLQEVRTDRMPVADDLQISPILTRYSASCSMAVTEVSNWLDFGTLENYHAVARLACSSREFNQVRVFGYGVCTKTSSDAIKLRSELEWLSESGVTPVLVPRVFSARAYDAPASYDMEYYDYSPLSESLVYVNLPSATWSYVFDGLLNLLFDAVWSLADYRTTTLAVQRYAANMYLDKTLARLLQWQDNSLLEEPFYRINDRTVPGFRELWRLVQSRVEHVIRGVPHWWRRVHGDLTFSNVLYSPRAHVYKLLDPRGSFGGASTFGDVRYDIAKLRQSYDGSYDAISHDLFSLERCGRAYEYAVWPHKSHVSTFDQLVQGRGFDLQDIVCLEALQFLSMIPLHSESPSRQLMFFLRGVELLHSLTVTPADLSPLTVAENNSH